MKMYDSYKDSGVEWIDQIPSDWAVLKNKYFTKAAKEPSQTGEEDLLSVSEYSGVVPRKTIRIGEDHITRSDSLVGYLVVKKGQLVSNIMLMWKRGLGVSDFNGIVSPAYSVFDFTQGNPRYFHYLYRTDMYISEFRRNSTGVIESRLRLYDDSFGAIHSHFPPIETQNEIVHFLNAKTSLIDSLIEKTQRKIELLREKRTSIINEAVTKGLNSNIEMKDSGIKWIGKIPSHWLCNPMKYITEGNKDSIRTGPFGSSLKSDEFKEEGIRVYNQRSVYDEDFSKSQLFVSQEKYEELKGFEVIPQDVLVTSRGTIGRMTVVPDNGEIGVLHPCLIRLRLNREIISDRFLWYYMNQSSLFLTSVSFESNSTTIEVIYSKTLSNIKFPLPPLSEQQKIVEYLENNIQKLDKNLSIEKERANLLKEYRQSLISSVVTGKIKVTEDA
jgi:type I restriction enzyme, S subunit